MRTEVKLYWQSQAYEAPSVVPIWVSTEKGFARSSNMEDVGKDDEIEFY